MEACNSFLALRGSFRMEGLLRFPSYYTTFSTYDQILCFGCNWFPSNSYYHSNGDSKHFILVTSIISKSSQTLDNETFRILTSQSRQLVSEIRKKSIRVFSTTATNLVFSYILGLFLFVLLSLFFLIPNNIFTYSVPEIYCLSYIGSQEAYSP